MATITPRIVNLVVNQVIAPTKSTLQQSGAFVSVGGTTIATGTYQFLSSASSLTSILAAPGTGNEAELVNMNATFWAQGTSVGVYVLELGVQGTAAAGISALSTWITANPGVFYAYLTPATWDGDSTFAPFLDGFISPSAQTYFFVNTSVANIVNYKTYKSVFAEVPSPTAASTEFQPAAAFYQWLVNNPSSLAKLAPMQYRYQYGVTPWSLLSNSTNIDTILTDYGNVILTPSEAGILTPALYKGTFMSGDQAAYWYAADWFQINVKQQLAAAIVNGSNNPQAPLYYNQNGINTLKAVAQNVANTAISYGMFLSPFTVNAIDFYTYTAANPSDYAAGVYNGLSATGTPQLGFESITFNFTITNFVAAA